MPPFVLEDALRVLFERGGSDLHIKVGSPPQVRIHGVLEPLPYDVLKPADTQRVFDALLTDPDKRAEFESDQETEFSFSIPGVSRYRVTAFRQRSSISLALRAIPTGIDSIEALGLPNVISRLAEEERGLILVTGATGSGKSTTLAAIIDQINASQHKHIVTVEDPIEFLHRDNMSIINQREVGQDTRSFRKAMRRVLRQDPDVILVGEMRDEETVHAALSAAETGHLVLSTLHTVNASETINRIIDFFPPYQQSQVRAMIAGTLRGVISQRLAPHSDGEGRVAVCEILVQTARVVEMIADAQQTGELMTAIEEGAYYGMQTFDQHLLEHVVAGRVDYGTALRFANSPHDFRLKVEATGFKIPASMKMSHEGLTGFEQPEISSGEDSERLSADADSNGSTDRDRVAADLRDEDSSKIDQPPQHDLSVPPPF